MHNNTKHPIALIILDGFGYRHDKNFNAVTSHYAPHFFSWLQQYPHALLHASGEYVGLPDDMIGNSEVGHLTIGAGRIVEQPAWTITRMIDSGELFHDKILLKHFNELKKNGGRLHLIGLLSDAGVHSLEYHLIALIEAAVREGIKDIIIHPFLDGRDVPPKSATIYLERLEAILKKFNVGKIGSMHGRFYAMDRDQEWQRTEKSYRVLTQKNLQQFHDWREALKDSYEKNITDEFFEPLQLTEDSIIGDEDGIIFFNFREDRARQLTLALVESHFSPFKTQGRAGRWMITAIEYIHNLPVSVLLKKPLLHNTLLGVLEDHKKSIFSIAETEKYAHITYFFNGGKETIRKNETRILIPSVPHQHTYAEHPEMSAEAITHAVIDSLSHSPHDFYLINYANADMVGHSGNFEAACKAVESIDHALKELYDEIVVNRNGTLFITGDHGNAEDMWDYEFNQPQTAHTRNLVYFLCIDNNKEIRPTILPLDQLADIAPFVLDYMHLEVPVEMKKSKEKK